jgi:hypothetical protein
MPGDAPSMASNAPKVPWDQRLTEHLARQSREAANDPARRRNPPFREQIRSPYYWLSILALGALMLIWTAAKPGRVYALAAILYVIALLASAAARRDARAAGLRCASTTVYPTSRLG